MKQLLGHALKQIQLRLQQAFKLRGQNDSTKHVYQRLFILIIMISGCSSEPPTDISADQILWQTYDSQAAFRLRIPEKRKEWSNEFHSNEFGTIRIHHVQANSHGLEFRVNFNEFNQRLTEDQVRQELQNVAIPSDGTLIHEQTTVSQPDCVGVEVVLQRGPNYTVGRYYIHKSKRLYSLLVTAPWDVRHQSDITSHFFDSFEVGEKPQVVGAAAVDSESTTNNQI